jgi:signal peptidase I
VLPGLGHIFAGHGARGLFWLLAPGVPVVAGVALVFSWWPALLIGLTVALLLTLASILDAYRAGKSPRQVGLIWPSVYGAVTLSIIASCVGMPLAIRAFVVESFRIPSGGMCPTLSVGDNLFVDKFVYDSSTPSHGDIVVYEGPDKPGMMFLQRVVGVGGDIVEVREGRLIVSGRPVPTTELTERGCDGLALLEEDLGGKHRIARDPGITNEPQRHEVPPGHVFVVGDNRDNSYDSRLRGPVPVSAVKGRAFKRWMHGGQVVWEDLH